MGQEKSEIYNEYYEAYQSYLAKFSEMINNQKLIRRYQNN